MKKNSFLINVYSWYSLKNISIFNPHTERVRKRYFVSLILKPYLSESTPQ